MWKAHLCQYQRELTQEIEEIDANEEISELALEGRGSEFDDFDAFDEIEEFVKSASLRGPVGSG